jgi:hypothetical protein
MVSIPTASWHSYVGAPTFAAQVRASTRRLRRLRKVVLYLSVAAFRQSTSVYVVCSRVMRKLIVLEKPPTHLRTLRARRRIVSA